MKVYYKPNPTLTFELEVSGQKDVVEQLAQIQEIVAHKCGKCQCDEIVFQVRVVDDNKYYEAKCTKCGATLSFGVHKKGGTLFPKRYTEEEGKKVFLPSQGWTKWDSDAQKRV